MNLDLVKSWIFLTWESVGIAFFGAAAFDTS